jgi:hypothetical protein
MEGRDIVIPDVVPHLIPGGGVSLLTGASGIGKSALLAGWLKAIRDGQPVLGIQPRPVRKIGMICTDRRWQLVKFWLDKVGLEEDERFQVYCVQDDFTLDFKKFFHPRHNLDCLVEQIELLGLEKGDLLVIDPIAPYMGNKPNDYAAVMGAIGPLSRKMAQFGLTVAGTAHTPKQKGGEDERVLRIQDRVLGSTALAGYSNSQFALIGDEEAGLGPGNYALGVVCHTLPSMMYRMVKNEQGLFEIEDKPYQVGSVGVRGALGESARAREGKVVEACMGVLEKILTHKPMPRMTLLLLAASAMNGDTDKLRGSIDRALGKLVEAGRAERGDDGYRKAVAN